MGSVFAVHTPGGWQIHKHLPLNGTQGAKLTDGALTLKTERGGNRYDKTSCQGQARGSQLQRDGNIQKVTLSYKQHHVQSSFQTSPVVVLVCLLYVGDITVNILFS